MTKDHAVTAYETASKAITDEPTLVYWLNIDLAASGSTGTVYIRDGFDTSGEIKLKLAQAYSRLSPFVPPIRCAHGLYVEKDAAVTSYTVGYRRERELDGKE